MKANELMIGDWVNIYVFPNENPQKEDLFPARINTIMTPLPSEGDQENIECIFKTIDGETGCASRPVDTCQPIPLTPDILEKNGFHYTNSHTLMGADTYVLHLDQRGFDLKVTIKLNDYFALDSYDDRVYRLAEISIGKWYVHNLQHTLKLCGIDKEIVL